MQASLNDGEGSMVIQPREGEAAMQDAWRDKSGRAKGNRNA
jgi:hypothetical protein